MIPPIAYLTAREAACYLRLSLSTLAKYRVSGGGPAYVKAGRKILYRRADLDAWMTAHSRASTSDDASEYDPKEEGDGSNKRGPA